MRKSVKNATEFIYLTKQEFDSLEAVHGCSGFKYLIDNRYFMEDDCVDTKDYTLCLEKEFHRASLYIDASKIRSITETMEVSVDFERHKGEKKHALKLLFSAMTESEIDHLYQLTLNACRRYTSANVFKIAKVAPGSSRINRYILFSEIANIMGLSDCVPTVSDCCLVISDHHQISGCAIEKIEGIDIAFWDSFDQTKKDSFINYRLTEEGYRSLTSIHIIDYLTGQIDRNVTNIICHMNQHGEISKCVAIDNDVCFGCSTIDDLKITRLGDFSQITYIDKSLYDHINALDKAALEKLLSTYLSPKEAAFFFERYNKLLDKIRSMKVVNMGEWSNYRAELDNHPYIKRFRAAIKDINEKGMA